MKQFIVGVDISQHQIDTAYWNQDDATFLGQFQNMTEGFNALFNAVEKKRQQLHAEQVLLVIEPTGGYEQALARFALNLGWQVSLPNPHQVRQWAKGIGMRAKTDRQDAILLARYGAIQAPKTFEPPSEEIELLDDMLSRLQGLESMLTRERNRLHAWGKKPVRSVAAERSLLQSIAFIEQQIDVLKQAINHHFDAHPPLKAQKKRLLSVPGVGQKNVLFLLVLLSRFSQMTHGQASAKQLTAYVGLDPVPHQSGTSVYKRSGISRQGNHRMRHYLFMGALGGVRGQNPLTTFYKRLVGRGKAKMVALIAAARKILVWSWAIFQQGTIFDASRYCESN